MGARRTATLATTLIAALAAQAAPAQNRSSFTEAGGDAGFSLATVAPRIDCAALAGREFPDVTFMKAERHEAAGGLPAYCRVFGVIRPEIQFEVVLPERWNRRFYMFGNGGYGGEDLAAEARVATRDAALRHGFAVAQQNTGHDARAEPLATFAENNLAKLVDYAERGVHVTAQTAKRLIHAYYDRPQSYSYFDGCSTGGRQGLISAQRHPDDFDGIAVGAPVLDFTGTQLWGVWNAQALAKAPISLAQLPVLARAVIEKCDALDGARDGLLEDPRRCPFDPAADLPRCTGGESGDACFTGGQIGALQAVYGGVKVRGETVFPGQLPGAEPADASGASGWEAWIVAQEGKSRQLAYGETFLKYFAFAPAAKPDLDWTRFDFDKDTAGIDFIRTLLDATDPDLSDFASRGGRILMYFGWADPALNPMMGVNYYEDVRRTMGAATDGFLRLFMAPGMFHCRGGFGPDRFDPMTPLIAWVEEGRAPERIEAAQMEGETVRRTRPLCPYPQAARYSGSGSLDEAASFACVAP